MIEPDSVANLKDAIADCIHSDEGVLTSLRDEIRPLRSTTRPIQPRATTSISLVGTDGGNNQLRFDPFLIQLVRVVDSSNNEYCLEAVSPTTTFTRSGETRPTGVRRARVTALRSAGPTRQLGSALVTVRPTMDTRSHRGGSP
jgi:hypothetical protein